jgi:hypothetical protein
MATKASRIALAGSNISSTGEVDADLLDNIDSAAFLSLDGNSRLGIGSANPDRALTIEGSDFSSSSIRLKRTGGGANNDAGLQFESAAGANADTGMGGIWFQNSLDGNAYALIRSRTDDATGTSGRLDFMTGTSTVSNSTTPRMTIKSGGSVGIGTNDPAYRLDVGGIGAVQQRLKSSGDTGYTQGALVIESSDSSDNPGNRGQGVYYYNVPNLRTWYTGTLYNNGNKFGFGYKQASGFQVSAADNANAIMTLDGDNSLLEVKKTSGTLSGGASRSGAIIKLHHEAQWESGYGNNAAASTNDYLGSIEFSTGDNSTGEGVRAAIRGTVDSYYNQNSIVFETAAGNVAEAPQERMRVLHNGNVGIGVANPGAQLSVSGPAALANLGGGSTGSSALYVNSTSGHVGELIQVLKDGTTKMHMANGGDLALGHSSPSDKLDIQGVDNGLTIRSATANRPVLSLINGSSTMLKISANGTYAAIGDGSNTNRYMSFKGGYVGIGRTDPAAILDVANNTGSDTAADTMVRFDNSRGSDWNVVMNNNNTTYGLDIRETPATGFLIYGRVTGGNNTFILNGNGNVKNANNSYGAISDLKLKENIIDATSQWEDIKALRIRKYSFKTDELDQPNQLGVIAQELETAGMGGLVNTVQDVDIDVVGKPLLDTYTKDVKYSVLYMKAVKALQEAMSRIETLEARLTAAGIE